MVDKPLQLERNPKVLGKRYTAVSLQQHIQANDFVRQFRAHRDFCLGQDQIQDCHLSFEDDQIQQTLVSMTVDQPSFSAYFCSQLSCNEKLLLSTGDTPQKSSNNIENQGLPSPSQLQHVFDVLSTTVRTVVFIELTGLKITECPLYSYPNYLFNPWITKFIAPTLFLKIELGVHAQCKKLHIKMLQQPYSLITFSLLGASTIT